MPFRLGDPGWQIQRGRPEVSRGFPHKPPLSDGKPMYIVRVTTLPDCSIYSGREKVRLRRHARVHPAQRKRVGSRGPPCESLLILPKAFDDDDHSHGLHFVSGCNDVKHARRDCRSNDSFEDGMWLNNLTLKNLPTDFHVSGRCTLNRLCHVLVLLSLVIRASAHEFLVEQVAGHKIWHAVASKWWTTGFFRKE